MKLIFSAGRRDKYARFADAKYRLWALTAWHPTSFAYPLVAATFLALVAAGLFFHRLGARDLWGSHEARAAQDAQRMLDDGAWGLPRLFDDHIDLQKPPMYYWLVAGLTRLSGSRVDAWLERLPAALSATGCIFIIFALLWRRGRPFAGFLAALFLATAQHFTWLARTGRIDMPLTFCVTTALITIGRTRRWRIIGFLAIAVALLLKGPIGLILPVAVLSVVFLFDRWVLGSGVTIPRTWWWGFALSVILAAPWFIWANVHTQGELFRVFFWHHNMERAMGSASELAVHPWWYYGPRLLVDAAPWTALMVPAVIWFVRCGRWREDYEASFGLLWLLAVTATLSLAKFKRADYLLPAYPGLAMFLGCVAERWWEGAPNLVRRVATLGLGLMVAGAVGFWAYFVHVELPARESEQEQKSFAEAIRREAPAPQVILFFRAECHALAFHLGRPVNTFLEWENLDVWAGRPGTHYIVMPPGCAEEWPRYVSSGRLERVLSNTDLSGGRHEKPLVLMRTRPNPENRDAASRRQTADCRGSPECGDPDP
jgi:4-amino-4-deoxy-L-arabinose transferase-like glycosyltransferase